MECIIIAIQRKKMFYKIHIKTKIKKEIYRNLYSLNDYSHNH